jgi:hypothetical protein
MYVTTHKILKVFRDTYELFMIFLYGFKSIGGT